MQTWHILPAIQISSGNCLNYLPVCLLPAFVCVIVCVGVFIIICFCSLVSHVFVSPVLLLIYTFCVSVSLVWLSACLVPLLLYTFVFVSLASAFSPVYVCLSFSLVNCLCAFAVPLPVYNFLSLLLTLLAFPLPFPLYAFVSVSFVSLFFPQCLSPYTPLFLLLAASLLSQLYLSLSLFCKTLSSFPVSPSSYLNLSVPVNWMRQTVYLS